MLLLFSSIVRAQERRGVDELTFSLECDIIGELYDVSFGGIGNIRILRDYAPHSQYLAPEWSQSRFDKYPVAYKAGSFPSARAEFVITCDKIKADPDKKLFAKGLAMGFEFASQKVDWSGTTAIYNFKQANNSFPAGKVDYFDPFKIDWYLSTDEVTWSKVGTSDNNLYVPLYQVPPKSCNTALTPYHSVLYYACQPAKGQTTSTGIFDKIWEKFMTTSMPRIDKPSKEMKNGMFYWGGVNPLTPQCRGLAGLLNYEDANCGEWSQFFSAAITMQGIANCNGVITANQNIPQNDIDIFLLDYQNTFDGTSAPLMTNLNKKDASDNYIQSQTVPYFFVKNWSFPDKYEFYLNGSRHPYTLPSLSTYTTPNNVTIQRGDQVGLRAQGMNDPHSLFQDHVTICIGSKIYDPSYGTGLFNSIHQWETASIDGYGFETYFQDPVTKQPILVVWVSEREIPILNQVDYICK